MLIWSKGVPASDLIEKNDQAFCVSCALIIIMSHSLDAWFNSYDKNPPSSQLSTVLTLRRLMTAHKTNC